MGTFATGTVPASITVPQDQDLQHDVQLSSASIEGIVVSSADGQALNGVRVVLDLDSNEAELTSRRRGEATTDEQGRFKFQNAASGSYAITAGGSGVFGLATGGTYGMRRVRGLEVRDGQSLHDVRIVLEPGAELEGKVTGTDNEAVSGAAIFLRDENGAVLNPLSEVTTDERGIFHFRGVSPGVYTVHVRSKAYAFFTQSNVSVERGATTELSVRLSKGVEVFVRLHNAGGENVAGAWVEILNGAGESLSAYIGIEDLANMLFSVLKDGRYRVGTFAAGDYRLRATIAGKGRIERTITLSGSGEQTIDIDVEQELKNAK
jgi:uncharacterized surface anchored protein